MSFDGLFTRAITNELSSCLKGGRISKIHQPYKNEIILIVRANGRNHKLLFSVHPSYARVQLTEHEYENPSEPPMFCMLLRKHLEGHILENIYQIGLDRIIVFEVKGRNELGDISHKQIIVEIMGRHSNIILVDKKKELILDSIKHISYAVNSHRAILPGQTYIAPPKQDKQDPIFATEKDILKLLDFNGGKLDQQLVESFAGVSPLLAKEIVFKSGLANSKTLPRAFTTTMKAIKEDEYHPAITSTNNKESFYLFPIQHLNGVSKIFTSCSELLDRFYFGKADRDRVKQQASDLERFINNEREKNEKKIKKLHGTIEEATKADQYQRYGELLTANIYSVSKGMKEVQVLNYYDEDGGTITIPLNPQKSPSENAQNFFKKYQKQKTALLKAKEQLEIAKNEVNYFENLTQQIETASTRDIAEIREELIEEGYLKNRQKLTSNKKKQSKPVLDRYISGDGTEILVGKNNKQNDYLTNRISSKDDIWLHTKDIPGSHVVIRNPQPSEETLMEAAMLAAYFSKARQSSSVPVDYTKIRYVKKPNGSKPGYVIYDNQQTLYVTPNEDTVLNLNKNK